METRNFDLTAWRSHELKSLKDQGFTPAYQGGVLNETTKAKITTKFETRPHTFGDGESGEVAQKLTIEIDFTDLTLQPHADFEDDFSQVCADAIAENIEGIWDNQED